MKTMTAGVLLLMAIGVSAQEGIATLPRHYRLQFENNWVKVTAVRYGPNEKLPGHTHTPNPSAYVYLNDGPPVIFSHVGGKAATRPATRAGAFRVYRGLEEVHEVENTGSVASEFLRVELKTAAKEPGSFWGKFERGAPSAEPIVHFNHAQVRISRNWIQPGQPMTIPTLEEPALVIALQPGSELKVGQERWVAPSSTSTITNGGSSAIDVLRFDFKTVPAAKTSRH